MSDLIRRVRQVLADAEMLSEGSTQSWDKSSPSADQDRTPRAQGKALRDALCADLTALVDRYEAKVKSTRKGPDKPAEGPDAFRSRIIDEHAGVHYQDVAEMERVSVAYVRKIRGEAGVDQKNGLPLAA